MAKGATLCIYCRSSDGPRGIGGGPYVCWRADCQARFAADYKAPKKPERDKMVRERVAK